MRWGLLLLFCVGCGRVGFDAVADASLVDASFGTPVPITVANSSSIEDDASMTGDMLELFFISDRSGGDLLYRASRSVATDAWSMPAPVTELNGASVNNAKVSYDGLTLVFSSTRAPNAGVSDIWIATRPDRTGMWTPRRLDELATAQNDIEPWLIQSDALTIYFTSSRTGPTTLWTATRATPIDPFANPARIDELASTSYDGSPWVATGDQLVVFHSARDGNYNLYYATRTMPTGPWSAPVLMPDLNTDANESDAWISPDGRTLLYTSNRDGTDDLYITTR